MQKFFALLALIAFLMSGVHVANALSTEHGAQNSDGSPKFTDPDDNTPNLVPKPDGSQAGFQAMPFDPNPVTPPSLSDRDPGAAAFDRAYAHIQNR